MSQYCKALADQWHKREHERHINSGKLHLTPALSLRGEGALPLPLRPAEKTQPWPPPRSGEETGEVNFFLKTVLLIFAYKSFSMNFPENLRYTKDHEWIRMEGKEATIGITDFAQRELGDIVYVEVETIGKALEAGAVFGTVEAVKTVSDLFIPVSGTITELNPALAGAPELVNTDPYGKGWMIKMTVNNPADVDALLDAGADLEAPGSVTMRMLTVSTQATL